MRRERWIEDLLYRSRVAHLATSTRKGIPHVVPICFAYDERWIYSSVDEKPKRVAPERMRRLRNIIENKNVCLVVDKYSESWGRLCYVIIRGVATIMYRGEEHKRAASLLRRKYHQYLSMRIEERPVIRIKPTRLIAWRAARR